MPLISLLDAFKPADPFFYHPSIIMSWNGRSRYDVKDFPSDDLAAMAAMGFFLGNTRFDRNGTGYSETAAFLTLPAGDGKIIGLPTWGAPL